MSDLSIPPRSWYSIQYYIINVSASLQGPKSLRRLGYRSARKKPEVMLDKLGVKLLSLWDASKPKGYSIL